MGRTILFGFTFCALMGGIVLQAGQTPIPQIPTNGTQDSSALSLEARSLEGHLRMAVEIRATGSETRINSDIESLVTRRLTGMGIEIVREPTIPKLSVAVSSFDHREDQFRVSVIYAVQVQFWQLLPRPGDPRRLYPALTWLQGTYGIAASSGIVDSLRREVDKALDVFHKDMRLANPTLKPPTSESLAPPEIDYDDPAVTTHLKVGDVAPNFQLMGTGGVTVNLRQALAQRPVVLAFFPAARSTASTAELQSLVAARDALAKFDVAYYMVGTDSRSDAVSETTESNLRAERIVSIDPAAGAQSRLTFESLNGARRSLSFPSEFIGRLRLTVGKYVTVVPGLESWAREAGAQFPLLSDSTTQVTGAYGIQTRHTFPLRITFFIGKDGRILAIDKHANPALAGQDIAARLAALGVGTR